MILTMLVICARVSMEVQKPQTTRTEKIYCILMSNETDAVVSSAEATRATSYEAGSIATMMALPTNANWLPPS